MPTYRPPSIAEPVYRSIALVAIPGTLWSAFEMYGLTLGGQQMLFFSITHTMPLVSVMVLVGIVALAVWALLSLLALFIRGYRAKLARPSILLGAFAVLATYHLAMLFSYEEWSAGRLRFALCAIGFAAVGLLVGLCVRYLLKGEDADGT